MNRSDLQKLSRLRVAEARALFRAGQFSGAYYLAGYAVECALKACIARQTQKYDFPDKNRAIESYVHSPARLLKAADLERDLQSEVAMDVLLRASWDFVVNWTEASRYRIMTRQDADQMIKAVAARKGGVLPWIQQRW